MDWTILLIPGAALLRSVAGWLENGLKDGIIDKYEWKLLGSTIAKYVIISLGFIFGLNLDPITAAGATILTDFGINTIRKVGI